MSIQLSPETEDRLRIEAQRRGVDVATLITDAVRCYLAPSRSALVSATPAASRRNRSAEVAWAAHPDPRFNGKWVVLEGDKVLASGEDPKSIYEEARLKGIASPFLIFVSSEDGAFAGGWLD